MAKKGKKKAIVALARKVLCILHHLLVNRENIRIVRCQKLRSQTELASSPIQMTEQDMINVLLMPAIQYKRWQKAYNCIWRFDR